MSGKYPASNAAGESITKEIEFLHIPTPSLPWKALTLTTSPYWVFTVLNTSFALATHFILSPKPTLRLAGLGSPARMIQLRTPEDSACGVHRVVSKERAGFEPGRPWRSPLSEPRVPELLTRLSVQSALAVKENDRSVRAGVCVQWQGRREDISSLGVDPPGVLDCGDRHEIKTLTLRTTYKIPAGLSGASC